MNCFIDAGAFISIANQKDPHHAVAERYLKYLLESRTPLVTSNFIFDEVVTWLRYRLGHKLALEFGGAFREAKDFSSMTVVTVDSLIEGEAWRIFEKYQDQKFSFTDCTSFVIMRQRRIQTAFCFDHHFHVLGFDCLPQINS